MKTSTRTTTGTCDDQIGGCGREDVTLTASGLCGACVESIEEATADDDETLERAAIIRARRRNTATTRHLVICRVSGGVTGTREAPLKRDGAVQYFATRAEAAAEAARLQALRNGDPYRRADFQYWAEEA